MSDDYGTCNRDYFAQQYPDLADVFRPKAKSQQSLATPTPRKPRPQALPLRAPERAGDVALVWLPLPPPELQPNRITNVNPYKLTRLRQATREASKFIGKTAAPSSPWASVRIDVRLYGVTGRMDRDGIIGWIKNLIDGLQDCGLLEDDNGVTWGTIERLRLKESEGRREVELQITKLA